MNNLPAPDDDEPIDKIEDSSDHIADTSGSSGAITYTYDPSGRQVHLTADLGTQSVSSQENPDTEIESKRSKASYSYA